MEKIVTYKSFGDMLEKNKFLVNIETVKIKDFIFSTNKLKLIRGASYLLDYMNQVEVPKILEKYGIHFEVKKLVNEIYNIKNDEEFFKEIEEKINFEFKDANREIKKEDIFISQNILYIGAGNAKFLVKDKTTAKNICKEVKEIYKKVAPSAKVVAEWYEIKENEKIWDAIDELAQKTAEKKSEGFPMLNIDLPFAVKCDLSGIEPAVINYKNYEDDLENIDIHETGYEDNSNDNEDKKKEKQKKITEKAIKNIFNENIKNISEESAVKIKYSNKMIKDDVNEIGFYSIIKKALNEDIHLNTEIDDYSVGDNFIGFIYTDGDGLGDFLKNIKKIYSTEEDYLKFMRKFSVILDRNTKYVLKEVLKEMYDKGKFTKKKEILKDDKKVGEKTVIGEFLIVGGDDVCAVFPADLAIEISAEFQKRFEEKMLKFTKSENENNKEKNYENITSSGGVIIAKAKTPMFQLFEQGIKLQKSAKLRRYNENKKRDKKLVKTGYIDFQVIGSEGNVDIKDYRKNWFDKFPKKEDEEKNKEKLYISERPYSINNMINIEIDSENIPKIDKNVSENIDKLIEKIQKLKNKNFPNTKIRYIYDLKKDKTKTKNEKLMESINILSKMNKEEIEILQELWGIKDKMELDFINEDKGFSRMFENIFDVLEIYDFIQKDENSDNKGGRLNEN